MASFSFRFLSSQLVTGPTYQVDKWLLSPVGPIGARSRCTTGLGPPGPAQWFGAGLARIVGLPLFPSGLGADRSTSLRGVAGDPTVAATGLRVPAMAVVRLSLGISSGGDVQLK